MAKRSFAEEINSIQLMIAGMRKNESELSLPISIADFEQLVSDALAEDRRQEELKAETQQSTERLNKIMKGLKEKTSRITSAIYGQYGKKSEKLEDFGIKPWKTGRRSAKASES
ncbi:MAG: hypothetical protein SVZ03_07400 [Spirochaetota bacterium]|nr:hypothetical protein [Spirochaetota bacterium]